MKGLDFHANGRTSKHIVNVLPEDPKEFPGIFMDRQMVIPILMVYFKEIDVLPVYLSGSNFIVHSDGRSLQNYLTDLWD